MTPLILVCILGIVVFLPLVFISADIIGTRDFERRVTLVKYHAYLAYVENCTRLGKPAPLPGAFGKGRR